jgi:hypothetical protein
MWLEQTLEQSYNIHNISYRNDKIYCGYCMIETSLNHSYDMFFNVSRVHCDNYCEILTVLGQVREPPLYSL